jgi:hypothetical protein
MQAFNLDSPSYLAQGQCYRVNSFDLGFINVEPIELIVEVRTLCNETHELLLSPLPAIGEGVHGTLILVAKWFQEVYPTLSPAVCPLRNARVFGRLVEQGIAVAEQSLMMPLAPVSLPASIQREIKWPSLRDLVRSRFHLSRG